MNYYPFNRRKKPGGYAYQKFLCKYLRIFYKGNKQRCYLQAPHLHSTPRRTTIIVISILLVLFALGFSALHPLRQADSSTSPLAAEQAALEVDTLQKAQASGTALPQSAQLNVPSLFQDPELPTGCESVALTDDLLSYGFDLDKTEIADDWLARSDTDFVNAFKGDPHSPSGHSAMAPAITQAAQDYLNAQGSSLHAIDMTGASISDILKQVAAGHPVIAWCSMYMEDPGTPYDFADENNHVYRLFPHSHTLVISGYNLHTKTIEVSDPLAGKTSYDLELFTMRYLQLGSQAIVIH